VVRFRLEGDFAANLPEAGQELTCNLAKVGLRQVSLHVLEVRVVEDVEELEAKLEIHSLGDVSVL
jgi:hypothetical protein